MSVDNETNVLNESLVLYSERSIESDLRTFTAVRDPNLKQCKINIIKVDCDGYLSQSVTY